LQNPLILVVPSLGPERHCRCQGELESAKTLFQKSLKLLQEMDDKQGIAMFFTGLAGIVDENGRQERMGRLLGAAAVLNEGASAILPPADCTE